MVNWWLGLCLAGFARSRSQMHSVKCWLSLVWLHLMSYRRPNFLQNEEADSGGCNSLLHETNPCLSSPALVMFCMRLSRSLLIVAPSTLMRSVVHVGIAIKPFALLIIIDPAYIVTMHLFASCWIIRLRRLASDWTPSCRPPLHAGPAWGSIHVSTMWFCEHPIHLHRLHTIRC